MENNLSNTKLAFIGCGVMAEAMIAGVLRKNLVAPNKSPRVASARESAARN
jgi:pyrroline-5-carboxylate reductase